MIEAPQRSRPLLPVSAPAGRMIAVASGKGGVGKTWLSITLAQALGRLGRSVLLFDGDLGLANVDIQLGFTPAHDLSGLLNGRLGLAEVVQHHPAGFDVLAGRSGSGALSALDQAAIGRVLGALEADMGHDHTVLDLGAGLDQGVRRMAVQADTLLVVVTDEPTAITDCYAVLKLYAQDRPDCDWAQGCVRVVVNQAASHAAGERTFNTVLRACESFLRRSPGLAGIIRRDEHVRDAIRRQLPLLSRHPGCPAAHDVEALVASLA